MAKVTIRACSGCGELFESRNGHHQMCDECARYVKVYRSPLGATDMDEAARRIRMNAEA